MKRAVFNEDTACVDVYVSEYAKHPKISIYAPLIEDSLRTTPHSYSQLQRLMYENPAEYVEMILDGTMQDYLDAVSGEYAERKKQLRKTNTNMSDFQLDSLAREFSMYDS